MMVDVGRAAGRVVQWAAALVTSLLLLLLVLLSGPAVVRAHAVVVDVSPGDGEIVTDPAVVLRVTFSEEVRIGGGGLQLLDDRGVAVDVRSTVDGRVVTGTPTTPLAEGTYVVGWAVVSADSHRITGSSVFHVGRPSLTPEEVTDVLAEDAETPAVPGVEPARIVTHGLALGGTLLATGLGVVLAGRAVSVPAVRRRVGRVGAIAAGVGVLGYLASVPVRAAEFGGRWGAVGDTEVLGDVLVGPVGLSVAVGTVGLGLVAWACGGIGRRRVGVRETGTEPVGTEPPVSWRVGVVAAIGGFLAVVAPALEGHTRTTTPVWASVFADVVHVAAAAIWVGGLVAILLSARAVRTRPSLLIGEPLPAEDTTPGAVAEHDHPRLVQFVSSASFAAVAAVSVTGVLLALLVVDDLGDLADSRYGRLLGLKVLLVVLLVAIGARNRWRVVPGVVAGEAGSGPSLWRSVRVEVGVLAVVVVVAAALVGTPPPGVVASADGPPAVLRAAVPLSSGPGSASFEVLPARVGVNEVYVRLVDADGEPLASIAPPTARARALDRELGPSEAVGHDLGDGVMHVVLQLPLEGRWEIVVEARTGEFDLAMASLVLDLGNPEGTDGDR
jgi:copper transport protein